MFDAIKKIKSRREALASVESLVNLPRLPVFEAAAGESGIGALLMPEVRD
jgi:hypothetical protein